ncbi:tape measure domain protein [compost metagenome]
MSANGGQIVVEFVVDNSNGLISIKQSGTALKELKSTLDLTANSVQKLEQQNDSLGRKFRDIVLTMGNLRFVAMDVNDVFLRLPTAILRSAGELEKMQVLMQGLSKEITKAGKIAEGQKGFNFVTTMAKNAPFELKALADTFVKFKTAGIDPTNGSMQALVDSVAKFGGTGESLKRASVAIQQMAGKGVVSMEELRQQLGEAVPTAMQDMADQMGMSMGELANAVSKGTLAAGPALDKMLLRMKVNNTGAAKEMMETWVGLGERLKTEFSLMAKTIAESDFGKAASESVKELITALGTDEAKRFADTIGTELGEAVRLIVSFIKTLIEYRGEIKLAAEAWIAYKVATSFFAPMVRSMAEGTGKISEGFRNQIAAANQAAASRQAASLREITASRESALAAERASLATIAAKEREVIAQSRAIDAMLAKQAILDSAMRAKKGAEVIVPAMAGLPGLAGAQSAATVTKAQKDLTDQIARQNLASTAARAELNALAYAHNGLANNVITTTTQMRALESTTVAATGAQRAMAMGASALRAGLALIGGGVGLVTIALIAGIAMWSKWARAAEEAQARKRRAEKKLSTQEDIDATTGDLKSAQAELAKREMFNNSTGIFLPKNASAADNARAAKELENRQRAVDEQRRKVEDLIKTQTMQRQSLRESEARDEAEGMRKQSETIIDASKAATESQLNESRARQSKLTENDKKTIAARAAETKIQTDLVIGQKKIENAQLQKMLDDSKAIISGAGPESTKDAARLRVAELSSQLKANTDEIVQMVKAQDEKIEYVTKEKKGGKGKAAPIGYDKVDALIGGLAGQKAELQAEIDSFNATAGMVDKGLAAAAKIDAQAKSGRFKHRGEDGKSVSDISPEQLNNAKKLAQDVAEMQEAMSIAQRIAATGRDIGEDYAQAIKIIANPLGEISVADRGKTGAFEDMLNKAGVDLDQVAERMGKTRAQFEQDINKIKGDLATVDLAKPVQEMVTETQRMNLDLILNDRDRTRAQLELERNMYIAKMSMRIQYLKDHKAGTAEILAAEQALANWQIANAQTIGEKLKTPMQKLADQWRDSTKAMEDATAQWAQQGMDAFINFTKTGKLEWKSLVTDILAGYLKIQMQKELTGLLSIGSSGSSGATGAAASVASSAASSGGGGFWSSLGTWVSGLFSFADGGVMSQLGSVPLRKYAKGGVATSPQLALYGEGSMNEAFVPLPDGRSIPVTMKSDGQAGEDRSQPAAGEAPNVTVNVINQTGQNVTAQQGATRFDGRQMILDVVLSSMRQPGSFRDGMLGAVGG